MVSAGLLLHLSPAWHLVSSDKQTLGVVVALQEPPKPASGLQKQLAGLQNSITGLQRVLSGVHNGDGVELQYVGPGPGGHNGVQGP